MLWVPGGGFSNFNYVTSNILATRPAAALGATVTPGNNSYGSYADVLTTGQVAQDLYGLLISFNSGAVSTAGRDTLATIGIDPAGGTSYTDTISHLLCSDSCPYNAGTGINYYFPLWVKAGSSIGCKGTVNNGTVGSFRVVITGVGQPTDQRLVKVGTFVETIGANTGASNGTSVTPGTASDGTWTSLGSTSKETWWHQQGYGFSGGAIVVSTLAADLSFGNGTTQEMLLRKQIIYQSTAEQIGYGPHFGNCERRVPAGSTMYGRLQASSALDAGTYSMIAYSLGG